LNIYGQENGKDLLLAGPNARSEKERKLHISGGDGLIGKRSTGEIKTQDDIGAVSLLFS